MTRPNLVVLAPIAPALTGNGLAMRAHLLAEAAGRGHDVHVIVIAVAGHQPAPSNFGKGTASVVDVAPARPVSLVPWVADPRWRERLGRLAPLPAPVLAAPPSLAAELASGLPASGASAVLALRLSLAPLGLALAELLDVPLIVDADDDDADFLRQSGQPDEAAAWDRVAQLCLPAASLVTASSAAVASTLSARHHLVPPVQVVPNAVSIPDRVAEPEAASVPARLLVVANFTYPPNSAGARWLVGNVVPLLDPPWSLNLVGAAGPEVRALAGDRVVVHGWVPDVAPHYESASVVAVPVMAGSGTRIKLLEAMARGRPVVTTTVGAAGLAVRPGLHALFADNPPAFADAVRAANDPGRSRRLVEAASLLVREQYDASVVAASAAGLLSVVTDP
ncbi:MAG TPA: glycosyltransferase family 4 protein [Acidimicrobiales bacterium]|nr:glycosyltransferase family 4 protein [Acidimicrobiales bacterium]